MARLTQLAAAVACALLAYSTGAEATSRMQFSPADVAQKGVVHSRSLKPQGHGVPTVTRRAKARAERIAQREDAEDDEDEDDDDDDEDALEDISDEDFDFGVDEYDTSNDDFFFDEEEELGSANSTALVKRKNNRHKIGIAADWSSPKAAFKNFKNKNTIATYNWSPYRPDWYPKNSNFWPMLWGERSIKEWGHVKKGYAKVAMGCNEVNQAGQAKMSVDRGVQIWKKYLGPLKKKGYKLVSHSTNQSPDGLKWHKAWIKKCPACHKSVDFYSVHWYGTDVKAFKKYMQNFHKAVKKPLVVSEFACHDFSGRTKCDAARAKRFMDNLTDWMNKQDYIKAYFWFGMWPNMPGGVSKSNSLLNGNGTPNALGKNYKAS